MARKANYDVKIEAIEAKIEKHKEALKTLKAQLEDVKGKRAKDSYKELTEYMSANNISAAEVLKRLAG